MRYSVADYTIIEQKGTSVIWEALCSSHHVVRCTHEPQRAGWPAETQKTVIWDLPSASNLLIGSIHFVCHSALSLVQPNSVVWLIHRTLCYLSSLKLSISLSKPGRNLREFVSHPQRGYTKLNLKGKNYNGRLCTKYNLSEWPMRIFLTGFCLMSNQHEFKLSQQNHIQILLLSLKVSTQEHMSFSPMTVDHTTFSLQKHTHNNIKIFLTIFRGLDPQHWLTRSFTLHDRVTLYWEKDNADPIPESLK